MADFGPNLVSKIFFGGGGGLPLLDFIHCFKLSLYAISKKTNEPNLRNDKKTIFGDDFHSNLFPKKIFWGGVTSTRCYTLLPAIIVCNFKEN